MTLPLYTGHDADAARPDGGHTGLWYTRFFDRFDQRQGWEVPKEAKRDWIARVEGPCGDQEALGRACVRQLDLAQALGGQSHAYSTRWHFATGLGLPHPVENGFSWHPTLGVPFLCGAAVKGLIRAWIEVFEDLPDEDRNARLSAWFGDQDCAGKLIFFDAIPAATPMLSCDVMTPHMGNWYQQGDTISDPAKEPGKVPADWHDPVPVPFLIAKKATFLFSIAPRHRDFAEQVEPAAEALNAALRTLGAGAKTAVGYGHMQKDEKTLRELTIKAMSPFERSMEEAISASREEPHIALLQAIDQWSGDEARKVALRIRQIMQTAGKWRPETKKARQDKDHGRTLEVLALLGDEA